MKPGAVSSRPRGRADISKPASAREQNTAAHTRILARVPGDALSSISTTVGVLPQSVGGGEALPGSFYGETCIPAEYVKKTGRVVWFPRISSGESRPQNVIVVRSSRSTLAERHRLMALAFGVG
jgi:hypothetical protein